MSLSVSVSLTKNVGSYESVKSMAMLACDVPFDQPYEHVFRDMHKVASEQANIIVEEEARLWVEKRKKKLQAALDAAMKPKQINKALEDAGVDVDKLEKEENINCGSTPHPSAVLTVDFVWI